MLKMIKKANYLFEVSWEVCNKVGGINTVVKSKVPQLIKYYKNNYYLIGPYFPKKAVAEFQDKVPPDKLDVIFEKLRQEGIVCHYGKWLINGEVNTILIDYTNYLDKNDEIKARLWDKFGIDSLGTEFHDFDEPILWGTAAGRFLEEVSKSPSFKSKIVSHFHEWLSGGALLHLKDKNVKIGTVFTTHATVLGRALAASNVDLYDILDEIDPDKEAYKRFVHPKHQIEKACALNSDVFTTVSEILSIESRYLLKKKPDLLLFNGLDNSQSPTLDVISIKHLLYRERIKEFLVYYFFPYYSFDLENVLIYFISGRYEFHNKGVDVFIKALSNLNKRLKKNKSNKTIIAFFWIPRDVIRIKPELSQNRAYYEDVKESINDNLDRIKGRIICNLISQKSLSEDTLFSEDFMFETKKKVFRFLKEGNPPLCTHDLYDEERDAIIWNLRQANLTNSKEDRVKVIFYPIYLTGADNLLDLNYNEAIMGTHLGVFPSCYEPWGYTPVETGALGVSSITTDFSGFARYISKDPEKENPGIFVIPMFKKNEKKKVENLFEVLYHFSNLDKEGRIKSKMEAHRIASSVGWERLVENYIMAHDLAIEKVYNKG